MQTTNPKFCSRRCATTVTNQQPKRKLTKVCTIDGCAELVRSTTAYCKNHKGAWRKYLTLGDVRAVYNSNQASMIRAAARQWATENLDTSRCWYCGYSLKVDCCHITAIRDLPDEMLIEDTCKDNLVILCKNHHWEFDHGHLGLDEILEAAGGFRRRGSWVPPEGFEPPPSESGARRSIP